jgi:Ni2+-binding GTPase involved in maturation of urease and hydrogenase
MMDIDRTNIGDSMERTGRPLLLVIGGFLGGGKTSTIQRTSAMLRERGLAVAVITNDQSSGLVDTKIAGLASDTVVEIPDGCFCCRFDTFREDLQQLASNQMPDVILAEAVGSCTDLAATVYQPLQQITSGLVDLAPLTIVADGRRVHDLALGGRDVRFPPCVAYLYERQLAEADLILLNKRDLLSAEETSAVMDYLASTYPAATIVSISATTGLGFETWVGSIKETDRAGRQVIDLDYGRYAEAEASLGWLNLSGTLHLSDPQSGTRWLQMLLDGIAEAARDHVAEIAHVKAWIDGGTGSIRGHLVDAGRSAEILGPSIPFHVGQVLINARVPVAPDILSAWVEGAIDRATGALNARFERSTNRAFRPAPPVPVHRLLPIAG